MDFKELMNKAYEFEKTGFEIYSSAANKTQNPIVKSIFEYLANQEEKHASEIKAYVDRNQIELLGDSVQKTQEFFTTTVKEFKDSVHAISDDDSKAYEKALELEQSSYDFYKERLAETNEEEMKKFLQFLMDQENAHYDLIQKSYEFTKDPKHFFADNENAFFEG
ncbi:ferritin family protein [Candidatus Woesearchaeota archaeon]|nr:ferritin family protein [Candidatus Woesearchaeota archaeon]